MQETISFEQMSDELNIPRHIIHLWIKKFPILSPLRTAEGKISFKPRDISFAKGLKKLLIDENQNIKDVQKLLNERGIAHIIDVGKAMHSSIEKKHANNFSSMSTTHKTLANEVFKNISHIFNKDNLSTQPNTATSLVMKNHTPNTPLLGHTSEIETDTALAEKDQKNIADYEDKWRHLMEKTGKATPLDIAKSKPQQVSYDDIWEIDDSEEDLDLFQYELETIDDSEDKITSLKQNHYVEEVPVRKKPSPQKHHSMHNQLNASNTVMSIEKIEKIKHLISKLEILKDVLEGSGLVISKTLKVFGYNGIGEK